MSDETKACVMGALAMILWIAFFMWRASLGPALVKPSTKTENVVEVKTAIQPGPETVLSIYTDWDQSVAAELSVLIKGGDSFKSYGFVFNPNQWDIPLTKGEYVILVRLFKVIQDHDGHRRTGQSIGCATSRVIIDPNVRHARLRLTGDSLSTVCTLV